MKLPVCVKSSIQQTPAQARRHRHTHTHLLPFQMILSPADAMPANCKTMAVGECGRLVSWHALLWGTIWSQRSETDPILLLVAFTHIQHILPQQWSQSWSVPERTQHLRLLILSRLSLTFAGLSKSWRGPATSLKETCVSNSFNLIGVKWCLLENWSAVPWQDRMGHEKGASAWERLRSHAPLCHVCYAALTAAWSTWWLLWWCWTFPPWEGEFAMILQVITCSHHDFLQFSQVRWDHRLCWRFQLSTTHGGYLICTAQSLKVPNAMPCDHMVFLEWSPHFPFISPHITILDG